MRGYELKIQLCYVEIPYINSSIYKNHFYHTILLLVTNGETSEKQSYESIKNLIIGWLGFHFRLFKKRKRRRQYGHYQRFRYYGAPCQQLGGGFYEFES